MNMHLKNIHLNKNVITSAAIATAALGAIGAAAYAWKRHKKTVLEGADQETSEELRNMGPGEINPYVDTPTDPNTQN